MHVICYRIHLRHSMKEFSDGCFVEKRHTQDTKYIESTSFETKVVPDNGNETICCNSSVNLDSYGYSVTRQKDLIFKCCVIHLKNLWKAFHNAFNGKLFVMQSKRFHLLEAA